MSDIEDMVLSLETIPEEALGEDEQLLSPDRVPLAALLNTDAVAVFAESVAELSQMECSVLLYDPEQPRPLVDGGPLQIVRAPICQALSQVEAKERRSCLADVHAAAHKAMAEGAPATADCIGGMGCLYACPILLHQQGKACPKAAVVAAVHDIFHFHYADSLARVLGCPVAEAEELMCHTDRRSLDAGQLRRLRMMMAVQTQSFSRQISDRYAEFESMATIMEQKAELAQAYAELDQEFHVVGTIQQGLIPHETPDIAGFALATHYEPALRAGGDYYDFFQHDDGSWGVIIADVSGHGPAAAVVMAMMQAALHTYAGDPTRPDMLMEYANRYLCQNIMNEQFVTAFLGIVDPDGLRVRYVLAGHNPPLHFAAKTGLVREVTSASRNFALGIIDDATFEVGELALASGDLLLLYTDGITEGFNPVREQFGMDRMREAVQDSARSGASAAVHALVGRLQAFVRGEPPDDDQTLVAIQKL